jgi:extracellular factor (EF) 3-hydroxypalmitic acid methyl ester biosynthesis protein
MKEQGQHAPRRLRARRLRAVDLRLGAVRATGTLASGPIEAGVEDLSLHGLALVVRDRARGDLILAGDRIEALEVASHEGFVYRGAGVVRRVTARGDDLVLGVELSAGLDLGAMRRLGAKRSFAWRWARTEGDAAAPKVQPRFRAWAADARGYLEEVRAFLDAEERALAAEDQLTRDEVLATYLEEVLPRLRLRLDEGFLELGLIVQDFTEEEHAVHRALCRKVLVPLLREAPFMRRAIDKPLGYAGDYEMMNMLYRRHDEGESLFARALNAYSCDLVVARANRNRIAYLVSRIEEARARGGGRARVASVGCGPAREIAALLETRPDLAPGLEVALIDQEERALSYCERTLLGPARAAGAGLRIIRESIRRLVGARQLREALGERDLVYSAGLFDYLGDRAFTALAAALCGTLAPGGHLAIGNVARGNPSRWAIEYCGEWFLIHRSPDDLRALAAGIEPRPARAWVDAEPTGVNLFLHLER